MLLNAYARPQHSTAQEILKTHQITAVIIGQFI